MVFRSPSGAQYIRFLNVMFLRFNVVQNEKAVSTCDGWLGKEDMEILAIRPSSILHEIDGVLVGLGISHAVDARKTVLVQRI